MKFKPQFNPQFFSNSLQARLRPAAGEPEPESPILPDAEFASGLRVGEPLAKSNLSLENSQSLSIETDSPQMPAPGAWLADLLQQRKELKS